MNKKSRKIKRRKQPTKTEEKPREYSQYRTTILNELKHSLQDIRQEAGQFQSLAGKKIVGHKTFFSHLKQLSNQIESFKDKSNYLVNVPGPEVDELAQSVPPSFTTLDIPDNHIIPREFNLCSYTKLLHYIRSELLLFKQFKDQKSETPVIDIPIIDQFKSLLLNLSNQVNLYLQFSNDYGIYMQYQYIDLYYHYYFLQGHIQNIIKIRPKLLNTNDIDPIFNIKSTSYLENQLTGDLYHSSFVLSPKSSQYDLYQLLSPYIDLVLRGGSGLICATGEIDSGKTYTMVGPSSSLGIIPSLCHEIYNAGQMNDKFIMNLNIYFVRNNTVIHLNNVSKKTKDDIYLFKEQVTNLEHISQLLIKANNKRESNDTLIIKIDIGFSCERGIISKRSTLVMIDPCSNDIVDINKISANINNLNLSTINKDNNSPFYRIIGQYFFEIKQLNGLFTFIHCLPPALGNEQLKDFKQLLSQIEKIKLNPVDYQISFICNSEIDKETIESYNKYANNQIREYEDIIRSFEIQNKKYLKENQINLTKYDSLLKNCIKSEKLNSELQLEMLTLKNRYENHVEYIQYLESLFSDLNRKYDAELTRDFSFQAKRQEIRNKKNELINEREILEQEYYMLRSEIENKNNVQNNNNNNNNNKKIEYLESQLKETKILSSQKLLKAKKSGTRPNWLGTFRQVNPKIFTKPINRG